MGNSVIYEPWQQECMWVIQQSMNQSGQSLVVILEMYESKGQEQH